MVYRQRVSAVAEPVAEKVQPVRFLRRGLGKAGVQRLQIRMHIGEQGDAQAQRPLDTVEGWGVVCGGAVAFAAASAGGTAGVGHAIVCRA